MSATARNQVFSAVHTIGGLIPADMLLRISEGKDVSGSKPADYRVVGSRSVRDDAERHWDYLKSVWKELRDKLSVAPEAETPPDPVGLAITQWLEPLFAELGFGRLTTVGDSGISADDGGKAFAVSHRWNHVPIHLAAWNASLDKRPAGAGSVPPQSLVQECLNRTEAHLWGVLTNGRQLRLLRDSSALATAAYVEFDLEAIFDGELFSEFVLLYRLLHLSRFEVVDGAAPSSCWLEKWRTEAIAAGTRALDQLRKGVQDAITALGTGFLKHPDNGALREDVDPQTLHNALLRLVYRLLFLFVAEDRDVLHHPDADEQARERYAAYFSSARLRAQARRRRGTAHKDLYQALRIVLDALGDENGRPELGLPGLGGLFDRTDADEPLDGLSLSNDYLLTAVRHLSLVRDTSSRRWRTVDYRNLDAEELGSIYESLLELVPKHSAVDRTFELIELAGNTRKTTGSYYTPSSLIECLLDSALDPVIDDAVKRGEQAATAAGEPDPSDGIVNELLSLTVCDPACGSGHFLVAAARRIAKRVAAVRERNPEPTIDAVRHALHEVVARCVYGVDLNPMAVELAKVSLWMEALEPGKPLSFLDAHVKCGNALIGATPALLKRGIPDEAFKPIEGDDKKYAKVLEKQNANERANQASLFDLDDEAKVANIAFAQSLRRITTAPADSLNDVRQQEAAYREWKTSAEYARAVHVADAWCAAFVWRKASGLPAAITEEMFRALQDPGGAAASRETHEEILRLRDEYGFFHWHLEFPDVFQVADDEGRPTGPHGWKGGFSSIVGNPPWDTLSPDTREFFGKLVPDIRKLSKAEKDARIDELLQVKHYQEEWQTHQRKLFAIVHFLKQSGRYVMYAAGNLGKGDFNTYRSFAELGLTFARPGGYAAQIVQSGIYAGANASAIRKHLLDRCTWTVVYGFNNKGGTWFSGVTLENFAAYVACIAVPAPVGHEIRAAFGMQHPETLEADLFAALLNLASEDIRLQNPDTYAIPDVRDPRTARLSRSLYKSYEAFGRSIPERPFRDFSAEIHMSDRNGVFREEPIGLPIYEGRMIDFYDHRAKRYVSGHGNSSVWEATPFRSLRKQIVPQWYVDPRDLPNNNVRARTKLYRVGFMDVADPGRQRSFVSAVIPPGVVCGHKVPTVRFDDEWYLPVYLAIANSLVIDFLVRQRVLAKTMALNILDSMPIARLDVSDPRSRWLAERAMRLTCTSTDMTPFWNSMAPHGWVPRCGADEVPGEVDPERRRLVRAEIDAFVAREVYDISRNDLELVLASFPQLEGIERKAHGEFLTRRLVLEAFDTARWKRALAEA